MTTKSTRSKFVALFFALLFGSATAIFGQQVDAKTATGLIMKNAAAIGLSKSDLKNYRISDAYFDQLSGLTMVYMQQTYKGIDVFNSIQTLAFKDDQLASVSGSRIAKIADMINTKDAKASLPAGNAVKAAAVHLKLAPPPFLVVLKQSADAKEFEFGNLGISSVNIKSKLIWLPNETTNTAALTWQVEMQPNNAQDYWLVNVDALKGGVISKINLTVSCSWNKPGKQLVANNDFVQNYYCDDGIESVTAIDSAKYRVVPFPAESPSHPGGTPVLKTNPWELAGAGNNATTLKWNDDGFVTYDSTRGNNVLAQEDRNGNNGFGLGAHSSTPPPDLTFNFKPNFSKEPTVGVNQRFAITNLFYWNNIMHDISYQYGFNEASGNFQRNNLGRGGLGNDYVFADAQDGSGTNNANFATPTDGSNPRMQMFLFDAVPSLIVNQPASFAGNKAAVESDFSINNKLADVGPVSGSVVLYADNNIANTTHEACVAAFNAAQLNGKIALIDRGNCNFTNKVKNAQNAGAIAAIVVDNIPGEYPIVMGGTGGNTITIPAVMVSFETGDSMKQILAANTILSVTMKTSVHIDGDLDNGVIAHEYTHGISNRLTGGPSNTSCLNNAEQMGEGWSDYMALMVTTKWSTANTNDGTKTRPLGTYVLGQSPAGPGIRTHPYSTNIAIDPLTYADLPATGGEVHNIGEIWCTTLWEMTWAIIQQRGIRANLYKGNAPGGDNIALKLMMMGLKLQPCSPGFIDGRNAILKADTILFGGANSAAIWKAFAKRGMGIFASQGSSNNISDGHADFTEPSLLAPVTKGDFNAVKQNTTALLQWQNLNNENASKFVIERSKDGSEFSEIGSVVADNNLYGAKTYSFVDHLPLNGMNYYRLRQTAVNGTVVYSDMRTLSFNSVSVAPNPAKDKIAVTVSGNNKPLKIYLENVTGQRLGSYIMNGEYLQAKLPHLAAGMYYIKIIGEGINTTSKLIIQ
ncbi:MAG TPA: M36 family metallopeptidase [Chitinophagaceae bacterium]|nr:M36 family metallopeptidase [Chitinophagaceae bacterium]